MIRIALLDKHKLFRVSLESYIDGNKDAITAISSDSIRLVESYGCHEKIDLLIVDPIGFDDSFSVFINKVMSVFKNVKVVFLTDHVKSIDVITAAELGAFGFYAKSDEPTEFEFLLTGLKNGNGNEKMKTGSVVKRCLVEEDNSDYSIDQRLTTREIEILRLVCIEKTNTEISKILGVSVRTIESHRRRMIEKLDCKNIIGVILIAINDNLLDLPSCA